MGGDGLVYSLCVIRWREVVWRATLLEKALKYNRNRLGQLWHIVTRLSMRGVAVSRPRSEEEIAVRAAARRSTVTAEADFILREDMRNMKPD